MALGVGEIPTRTSRQSLQYLNKHSRLNYLLLKRCGSTTISKCTKSTDTIIDVPGTKDAFVSSKTYSGNIDLHFSCFKFSCTQNFVVFERHFMLDTRIFSSQNKTYTTTSIFTVHHQLKEKNHLYYVAKFCSKSNLTIQSVITMNCHNYS